MPRYSPLASPSATIACLEEWGLYTKKSLGQHFLVDDGTVGKILRLAGLSAGEQVVEIGPGIGTLSRALLGAGANVLAIEADASLAPCLGQLAQDHPGRFGFVMQDALKTNALDLPDQFKVVANLPYGLAATLVLEYFVCFAGLTEATVMVQKEVAERIMAKPGSKSYGAYTVKLALLASVQGSFFVARTNFLPPPRVDSTVVRLERRTAPAAPAPTAPSAPAAALAPAATVAPPAPAPAAPAAPAPAAPSAPISEALRTACFLVVDAAFAERRKTIRNSLRSGLKARTLAGGSADNLADNRAGNLAGGPAGNLADGPAGNLADGPAGNLADTLLQAAQIDPTRRAESLDPIEFLELARAFMQINQRFDR
ncbi:MAG: 16S rRNA (adenine(1518)-N(6)/adenine(1519)-N(6))-dimethyltransferase RsmA [Coriobacteriia bacterium]|nr:16S rRNA (adenine(1518)-N(6)/adenine(1519)-N(6))-dimethyltransferase RsmA [Coriobacteriia bacterium]